MDGVYTEAVIPEAEKTRYRKTAPAIPPATQRGQRREDVRAMRLSANWVNMLIAVGACFLVVFGVLALSPRPEGELQREVDYKEVADVAQNEARIPLAVPSLPEGWVANEAVYEPLGTPAFDTWYVSWVGPQQEWMSLRQSTGGSAWVESMLEDYSKLGERTIAGTTWDLYGTSGGSQGLVTTIGDATYVLKGTAPWERFEYFATQIR